MRSTSYKGIELLVIFVLIPISMAIQYPFVIKILLAVIGFLYIIYILLNVEKNTFRISSTINWEHFWKATFIKLLLVMIITTAYVGLMDSENLFVVLLNKPLLWIVILFIYSIFSVYPQELIYRTFFFQRYERLFKNEWLLIIVNATLFSLAHIFFRNTLVMVLTFLGGILFAFTFKKTKSTLLVSIEHAIYGCWLFTVGMGSMLGFPS